MEDNLDKLKNPASLICYRYTNKAVSTAPDLKPFKNLTELDLSGNCIETEIKNLANLKYLRKLSLSSNHISELWQFPQTLEYLNLSCNHISSMPDIKMPRLIYLDLSCNLIARIECLIPLQHLRSLYLAYNLIRDLNSLVDFPNLIEIDLEHNMLNSVSSMKSLVETENLVVFIIKKNPACKEFEAFLSNTRPDISQRNDVFCKDFLKATSLNCRLIKEGFGGSSTETNRLSRIYTEYTSHISQKDIIREQDEFNDGLISEVEELRKIICQNENKYEALKSSECKEFRKTYLIERQLMRLSEMNREQVVNASRRKKIEKSDSNYRAKYNLLSTTNKKLEQNYKDMRHEMEKLASHLNAIELEKYRLQSDLVYVKQENETLKSEISNISQRFLHVSSKNPSVVNKKVLKSNSTKAFCKSTVPKIRIMSKDSLIISPMSNASLPTVTQVTKRRDSADKDPSKMLIALPNKVMASSEKPLRIKKRSLIS